MGLIYVRHFHYDTSGSIPADQPLETVERKGIGHPDTICNALAEELSRTPSWHYPNNFGLILHHNVDKALDCSRKNRQSNSRETLNHPETSLPEKYIRGKTGGMQL